MNALLSDRSRDSVRGGRPVVLCVDDEKHILSSLRRVLEREPYDLLMTNEPEEALDWLQQRPIQLLIADQRMPGMTGTELLKATRAASPRTRRMILTAYADTESILEAINGANVHSFMRKPWNEENLKKTIRSLLPTVLEPGIPDPDHPTGEPPSTSPDSGESVLRINCHGKSVGEVMVDLEQAHLGLQSTEKEVWIVLEDLMSLDDSVLALLSVLVRKIFKSGARLSLHLKLKRDVLGS